MILVCGATGDLGGRIVRLLLGNGQQVRALVRPATDAAALQDAGVEVVRGDLREPATLGPAVAGVDTVITTANANRAAVDVAGNQNLVGAAQAAGVSRFVYVSAAYMGQDFARTGPLMAGKWQTEKALRASSMRHVIVRPDMFQESWLGPPQFNTRAGTALVTGRGQTPHRYVAIDDVAALCAHLAVVPDPPEVVEFGGPEELTPMQVVAAYEAATGRTFKVRHLPRGLLSVGHRVMSWVQPDITQGLGLELFFDTHASTWDDSPLREAGIKARSAGEFIARTAGARA
jgi:NADH dehydrogenase